MILIYVLWGGRSFAVLPFELYDSKVKGTGAVYKGIGASGGIGIGKVMLIKEQSLSYTPTKIKDTEKELERYKNAASVFCESTLKKAEAMRKSAGEKEAEILKGHILMIRDPFMNSEIEKLIKNGDCAEKSLEAVCNMFVEMFSGTDDELTKQRASDVQDIKNGVLSALLGVEETDISSAPKGTVLVTNDLTPSMTAGIVKENIAGIITQTGGKTSHSAIIARALEIPAVLSVPDITKILNNGQQVIVNGSEGNVIENPAQRQIDEYSKIRDEYVKEKEALKKYIGKETVTADGKKVELAGNIGSLKDVQKVLDCGGEGVGLFRTEFLFMDTDAMPTENEQFEAYKQAALILKDKPLVIRTLDAGGDKEISYLGLKKEENPFLGFRAVRLCLKRTDIYKVQLRALLRASAFGNIKIMIPLVTCVDEVRKVKRLVKELMADLDKEGIEYNKNIQIGIMAETAAAAAIADLLAKEADFFSIGTNDLTQYTMSVDRGNPDVEYLYSVFNPAVLRLIKRIIACGAQQGIMVGMCGEAASDPMLIPLLVSFGLNEYSVSASSVLAVRKEIARWTKEKADEIAKKAMSLETEQEVVNYLKEVTGK